MSMSEPEPTQPTEQEAPQWAKDLKATIDALPSKLRATISDDDRTSIAEQVHGLFDKSGAFERVEPTQPENEPDPPAEPSQEPTPGKRSGMRGFGARFIGDK